MHTHTQHLVHILSNNLTDQKFNTASIHKRPPLNHAKIESIFHFIIRLKILNLPLQSLKTFISRKSFLMCIISFVLYPCNKSSMKEDYFKIQTLSNFKTIRKGM